MYADKGGSTFILTDRGGEFSSEVVSCITDQLGFTKVYTSPYSPKSNSTNERYHSFLKNSVRKVRYNHDAESDELVHITKMAVQYIPPFNCWRESILPHVWKRHLSTNAPPTFTTQGEVPRRQLM